MKFEKADDISDRISDIVEKLNFNYIDARRVKCIRSFKTSNNAVARIWSLPNVWQKILNVESHYIVEVISERFDKLSKEDQIKTLIHELCLPYEENIVIANDDGLKTVKIGELIEKEFKIAKKINKTHGFEWIVPSRKYNAISLNMNNKKVEIKKINKLIRRINKEKETIKITTRDGRIIKVNPYHKIVYATHGYSYESPRYNMKLRSCFANEISNKPSYIRLPELFLLPNLKRKINNINLIQLFGNHGKENELKIKNDTIKKKGVKCISVPYNLKLDNELGRFFGFYLSEGSIDHSAGSVSFSFNPKEKEYHEFIKRVLKNRFNAIPKERTTKSNCKIIYTYSRFLQDIISNIIGFGEKAKHKKIPGFVYYAPDEFVAGLIDGWFAGDGTITTNKKTKSLILSSFSRSKDLIFGMLLLLNKFGIVSRLRRNQQDIAIQTYFLPKFMKYCKLSIKTHNLEAEINKIKTMKHEDGFKDLKYIRIRKIEKEAYIKKYLYSIEVKDNKTFLHASGIFTHNCHIPKTFSGALVSHNTKQFDGKGGHVSKKITVKTVDKLYKEYQRF